MMKRKFNKYRRNRTFFLEPRRNILRESLVENMRRTALESPFNIIDIMRLIKCK
jgi:hypothetical protein